MTKFPSILNGLGGFVCEVKMRWPLLSVILTSGHPRERVES